MSETVAMTLAEFLLARIAEDEEVAFGGAPSPWTVGAWDGEFDGPREILDRHGEVTARAYYGGTTGHVERFDPSRVLAECEAKRRIVEAFRDCPETAEFEDTGACLESVCAILALPHADHPDYREEWRP